jgi:hypothetical protein
LTRESLCAGSSLLWCGLLLGRRLLGCCLRCGLGDASGLGLAQDGWLVDNSWGLSNVRRGQDISKRVTYSLWCSSLLWLGCGLSLGSSLWLCDLGDLWLRGSLRLSSSRLLCGCGLLGSGLLLFLLGGLLFSLGLLGLWLGGSWLGLLLGELGSSRASCDILDASHSRSAWQTRTLWLSEDTLLDTRLERSVEQRVEHGVGSGDLVVGLHVLLQGDAAVQKLAVVNK